jgi:hypothetical protein
MTAAALNDAGLEAVAMPPFDVEIDPATLLLEGHDGTRLRALLGELVR